jgi:glutamine transport system ATP-binding protein
MWLIIGIIYFIVIMALTKLEDITGGKVVVDDFDLTDKKVDLDKVRQHIGMVFQHFNLFPHMTVIENVTMAPLLTKKPAAHQEDGQGPRGEEGDRTPGSSRAGGEGTRQAVDAVGWAEATRGDRSCLGDEFVDHAVRRGHQRAGSRDGRGRARGAARARNRRHDDGGVTHEMGFAREVASRVLFMDGGHIVEDGPPAEIFDNPKRPRLQEFLSKVL